MVALFWVVTVAFGTKSKMPRTLHLRMIHTIWVALVAVTMVHPMIPVTVKQIASCMR